MIVVYMRVRVYVRRIDMISCDMALKHYYLQLRENLIDQWSGGQNSGASEEACWELASLAILVCLFFCFKLFLSYKMSKYLD